MNYTIEHGGIEAWVDRLGESKLEYMRRRLPTRR